MRAAEDLPAALVNVELIGIEPAFLHPGNDEAPGVSLRQVEGKLWEIRVTAGDAARLFYVVRRDGARGEELYLLHAYKKQSQKAPLRDLEVARRRMREVLEA